jgi:hypothetical protein
MSTAANQFRHVRILFWSPDLASSVSFAEWEGCSETAEKRKGLIALLCGKSALNIVSEEYIAAVPVQGEVEREKESREVNSLQ